MNPCALCLAYAGFAALSMAMDRHWSDRFGRDALPGPWQRPLQGLGATLLVAALWICLGQEGFGIGLVAWLGCLTASGIALVLTLTYWPRGVTVTGPTVLALGMAMTVAKAAV